MRKTKTGATRNDDSGKINFIHISACAERTFCEYMHSQRFTKDGGYRSADNWKRGMPFKWYKKSFLGHIQDIKMLLEGSKVFEDGKEVTLFEAMFGSRFNFDGMVHVLMKDYDFERKYTDGVVKEEFNKRLLAALKEEQEEREKESV